MKFGVILHKTTKNMGDDVQTYAAMQYLPQVDYVIERENTRDFCSENCEPVAVIMSAWWLWKKWNWPPADCIIPKLVSMHFNNYKVSRKASSIYDEWLSGVGGEYFRKYGPIGVRDQTSLDFLRERGFDAYFSGCITLTLPRQKKTEDAGTYVCIVDLNEEQEKAARRMLENTGLEVRTLTHNFSDSKSEETLEERMAAVEDLLTNYQNAKFVITRRLHVSLPCLAMGVPVLSVVDMKDEGNTTRWEPYTKWLHFVTDEDFAAGNFEFDFQNPPENKDTYKETTEKLSKEITEFVEEMKNCSLPLEQVRKTTYTKEEVIIWQHELMSVALEKWLRQSRRLLRRKNELKEEMKMYKEEMKMYKKESKRLQSELDAEISRNSVSVFRIAARRIKHKILG